MGKKRVQLSLAFNTDSDSLYERVHFNDTGESAWPINRRLD